MPSKPFNAVNRSAATRGSEASFSRAVILSDQREPKDPRWSFASNKEDAVIRSAATRGSEASFSRAVILSAATSGSEVEGPAVLSRHPHQRNGFHPG
jgi:hypothetical protein